MNKYSLIVLFTLGIVGVALFSYIRDAGTKIPDQWHTSGTAPTAPTETSTVQPLALPATILYTDSGFLPNTLHVKVGTTVTFINNSAQKLWPASGVHPSHAAYPTTGGCIGSTFDACRGLLTGESWNFKFDIPGSWSYHNHLAPEYQGTVIVE
jgi:plastocyanin